MAFGINISTEKGPFNMKLADIKGTCLSKFLVLILIIRYLGMIIGFIILYLKLSLENVKYITCESFQTYIINKNHYLNFMEQNKIFGKRLLYKSM